MGDPVTMSLVAAVATSGAQLYQANQQAQAQRQAGDAAFQSALMQAEASKMEALQLESQAEDEKLRAMQEERNRRMELNRVLGRQMAMTAGRGIAIGSGSDLAISNFSQEEAEREQDIANYDTMVRQNQIKAGAANTRARAASEVSSGWSRRYASRVQSRGTMMNAYIQSAERVGTAGMKKFGGGKTETINWTDGTKSKVRF